MSESYFIMFHQHIWENVRPIQYIDTNLFHYQLTDHFVTDVIHLVKKTVNLYSKKYTTVDTSTYGFQFFLPTPLWIRLLIFGIPFNTLVLPFTRKAK